MELAVIAIKSVKQQVYNDMEGSLVNLQTAKYFDEPKEINLHKLFTNCTPCSNYKSAVPSHPKLSYGTDKKQCAQNTSVSLILIEINIFLWSKRLLSRYN